MSAAAADAPRHAEMAEVLAAAAAEARRAARMAARLQDALGAGAGPAASAEVQALDLLTQLTDGLAAYLDAAGGLCAPGWRIDAAEAAAGLTLADQARRLALGGETPAPAAGSGELDLF